MSSTENRQKASLPSLLISVPEGVIDLGWGHPSERLHPLEDMRQAANHVLSRGEVTSLQYGAIQGFGPLIVSLAGFLSGQPAYGIPVEPESLFLTSGASQALDQACTLFTQAGDTIFVEEPTYYLAHGIFADHRLNVVGVPIDDKGLRIDALEDMLRDASVPSPTALYVIPTYQNPTGNVLPAERRQALVDLAQRHDFIVFADEVYQLLHVGPPPPSPLIAYDTSESGKVLSIGSFSKILSPGLRLGWVQAKPSLTNRFINSGFAISGGGLNHFAANLAHATIELGLLEKNIETLRSAYGERIQALSDALRKYLPGTVSFALPEGGYFFWLNFGQGVDTEALLPLAREAGVSYLPGQRFSATRTIPNALRLSFALCESEDLVQGVQRLAVALDAYHIS